MLQSFPMLSSRNIATVKVDKATSELLISPDWTLNLEICDVINSSQWIAKELIKAMKKRMQHKNSKVQMLTLTLLETVVKNCDDRIHFHIAERKILDEMIKYIKKRGDLQVRLKMLVLIDSWQEAFGGPIGKHIHYYLAYNELRRCGMQFPQRSFPTPPIITPPITLHSTRSPQIRMGSIQNNSSRRVDKAVLPHDANCLNKSCLETIQSTMVLLDNMLQATSQNDQKLEKDEVIIALVDECRTNHRRLIQMLTNTMDEELLSQGIELNDALQVLLAKHDVIVSSSTLPSHLVNEATYCPNDKPSTISPDKMKGQVFIVGEEEEDESAQLSRRGSRSSNLIIKSETSSNRINEPTSSTSASLNSTSNNALVPVDIPTSPIKTTNEKDMVDFLSIVLSTSFSSEPEVNNQAQQSTPNQNLFETNHVYPTSFDNYISPWAHAQAYATCNQKDNQPSTVQINRKNNSLELNNETSKLTSMKQVQDQFSSQQPLVQPCNPKSSSTYTLPPWASTPGYPNKQTTITTTTRFLYSAPQEAKHPSKSTHNTIQSYHNQSIPNTELQSLQQCTSFFNPQYTNMLESSTMQQSLNPSPIAMSTQSLKCVNSIISQGPGINGGDGNVATNASTITRSSKGENPYIPPYRLFEDLNVFGNIKSKMRSSPYSSASCSSLVGARR